MVHNLIEFLESSLRNDDFYEFVKGGSGLLALSDILNQPIEDVVECPMAIHISPEATLKEAIDLLNCIGIGCILVGDDFKIVGIFTERDCLTKIASNDIDLAKVKVADYMTPNPFTLRSDESLLTAMQLMDRGNFRHVVVLEKDSTNTRIMSMKDIVTALLGTVPDESKASTSKRLEELWEKRESSEKSS